MGDIKRKIVVTADSREAESSFERMGTKISGAFDKANASSEQFNKSQEDASKSFKDLLKSAESQHKVGREKVKYLEREVSLVEKLSKKETDRAKLEARKKLDDRLSATKKMAPGLEQKRERIGAQGEFSQSMFKIGQEDKANQARVNNLKNELSKLEKEKTTESHGHLEEDEGHGGHFGHRIKHGLANIGEGALEGLGFGAVLSIGGFIGKMIEEGLKLEESKARAAGFGSKLEGAGGATELGMSTAEFTNYARTNALSRGKIDVGESRKQLAQEISYGLDKGQMNNLSYSMRFSKGQSTTDSVSEMLSLFKKSDVFNIGKDDFTLVGEKIQQASDMNLEQLKQTGQTNMHISAGLLAAGGRIGSTFSQDPMATFGKVNSAIQNPGNDFKRAFLYRAFKNVNPNATFFDVQKMQESGIYGKGNLSATLGLLQKSFSGQLLYQNASRLLGLKGFEAEGLMNKFAENPKLFEGEMSTSDLRKFAAGGKGFTPETEKWKAKFENFMGQNGKGAIDKLDEYVKSYEGGGMSGLMAQFGKDLWEGLKGLGDRILDGLKDLGDDIASAGGVETQHAQQKRLKMFIPIDELSKQIDEATPNTEEGKEEWLKMNKQLRALEAMEKIRIVGANEPLQKEALLMQKIMVDELKKLNSNKPTNNKIGKQKKTK